MNDAAAKPDADADAQAWSVPKVLVKVVWPPVLTVAENMPPVGFGDVGCRVYAPPEHDLPILFLPDPALVAKCAQKHTEIWISNQPWQPEVTAKLVFDAGLPAPGFELQEGTETSCTLDFGIEGSVIVYYNLQKTQERVAEVERALALRNPALGKTGD